MNKKFSIVTVTKNNSFGLARTLESVSLQRCRDFEVIIVDGHSDDGTYQLIEKYKEIIVLALKDNGTGIYAAMNQGIDNASGEWLIFMNAGDCFYDENSLLSFKTNSTADIVCGIAKNHEDTIQFKPWDESRAFWIGMPASHQSTFFKKSIMQKRKYDTSYKIAADFDYFMWAKVNGFCFEYVDIDVALIGEEGISNIQLTRRVWETYRAAIKYFPKYEVHRFYIKKLWWALKKTIKKLILKNR